MKKLLLFLVALVSALTMSAQDVIVKTDGSTVLCRVVEVNGSAVVYLKWSDLEGPRYAIERSQISTVNYQDGRQEKINDQTVNVYAPNNQQTGNWNYNDNALIQLDRSRYIDNDYYKKARKLKILGWTLGGSMIVGGATILLIRYATEGKSKGNTPYLVGAGILFAGGITTGTVCLVKANKLINQANQLSCAPVIQHEFELGNGKSFAAGVDLIRDNQFKNTALGLGLKFNF